LGLIQIKPSIDPASLVYSTAIEAKVQWDI